MDDDAERAGPPPLPGTPTVLARLCAAPVTTAVGVCAAAATLLWWESHDMSAADGGAFGRLLWRPPDQTWRGAWWTLVTSSLLHANSMHLVFNLYWLYRLMTECERRTGPLRWFVFFAATTAFASFAQLVLGNETGIGLSGFGYAAFGFAWRRTATDARWRGVVRRGDPALWLGWGVLCWVLTVAGVWPVGNAAHAAGLVVGLGWAWVTEPRRWLVARIGAAALAFGSAAFAAIHGVPWSGSWHYARAIDAFEVNDASAAIPEFRRAQELGFYAGSCLEGIATMEIVRHDHAAYDAAMKEFDAFDATKAREARTRREGTAAWEVMCAMEAIDARDAKAALPHLVRARDLGTERKWCLTYLAWVHYRLRNAAEYDATMKELKDCDPAAYQDALARYGAAVSGAK